MSSLPSLSSLGFTLRYACRSIRRDPGTSVLAVVVLALGIAGTTVTYSGVEAVVLRSLPFREPAQLVDIAQVKRQYRTGRLGGSTSSQIALDALRSQPAVAVFDDVAGYGAATEAILTWQGSAERARTWHVTSNFFSLLGVSPLIGRGFTPDDDRGGAASTIVLSHTFWMARFGGDPRAVGRTLTLDGVSGEIVGVMPQGVNFPRDVMIWRNAGTYSARGNAADHPAGSYWIVGRLRHGVSVDAAEASLDLAWAGVARTHPDFEGWVCNLTPLHTSLIGTAATPLWLLLGAGLLVLAIACANVANLLLVRAIARQPEVAVRLALGASGARIAGQFVAEALLLAIAGGGAGLLLAGWAVTWLSAFARKDVPALADVALNGHVVALALIATLTTGLVFGLVPGLWAARRRELPGSRAGVTRWRNRIGDVSLVGQLAITVVLLGAAGLVIVSLLRLVSVDTGYDATGVVAAQLRLPAARYGTRDQMRTFGEQVEARLRARGDVVGVAVGTGMPFGTGALGSIGVDGAPAREGSPMANLSAVSADYFAVLQIPLRAGRPLRFDGTDADAVVINEALARHFFPGENPIGHRVAFYGASSQARVVGVMADTRDWTLAGEPVPHLYQPFTTLPAARIRILVRARGEMATAAAALRETVREIDPYLPIDTLVPLRELMMDSIVRWRLVMLLLAVFAALALVMSAAGMYALMGHQVARRQQEMGIRLALGAGRSRILSLIVGRGLALTALGLALGLGGAMAAGRLLSAFLFEVHPHDPRVLVVVLLVMVATVLIACWLPARRAARIDPATLLRTE